MEKQYEKKITWTIKNLSSYQTKKSCSGQFVVGGCKWCLQAYLTINNAGNYLSLFLEIPDSKSLPYGWRRHAKFRFTVVNQLSEELSNMREVQMWFHQNYHSFGYRKMLDGGSIVNDEVMVVAEVKVLEVIGKSIENMDVNGFQVPPSQVEYVSRIFERHPDIARDFCAKNQHLRNACMSFLLSLIETLCQSLQDLSIEDLVEADIALTYLKDAGFKVDWLEKKLEQVKEKKEKEKFGLARLQEMMDGLLELKQKCSEMEEVVKKEEADLSATRSPLSFDDVL